MTKMLKRVDAKEDRIPTRIEKPIRDTTRTRRRRHHERGHREAITDKIH